MKVATKLIFGFLAISLLVGLVGFVSVYESSKALEKAVSEGMLSLEDKLIGEVGKEINERITDFLAYSKDLELQQYMAQSNKDFDKMSDVQAYISQKDREWVAAQKNEVTPFMQQLIDNQISKQLRAL